METGRGISIRIIAFAAFSVLCYFGAAVIITILLAVLLAYMLEPLVMLLRRIYVPRGIAIFIMLLVTGVIAGGMIFLLVDRAQEFSNSLPKYSKKVQRITSDILVYFLLSEKEQVRSFVSSFIRSRTDLSQTLVMDTAEKVVNDLNNKIRGFVFGYLLSTGILFVSILLLFISFQVQEAFIWAFLYTLLNMLPFVGAFLGMIPPIAIVILQFTSLRLAIVFLTICMLVHLVYANWLIPRTTGPRTRLTPLAALIAMMYWGFLWGAIGIFLAIPITAVLRSVWMQYRALIAAQNLEME
jgi:predicted PurR-regulated permease PerM